MSNKFEIEKKELRLDTSILESDYFEVKSSPYNYQVVFETKKNLKKRLENYQNMNGDKHFLFVDSIVNRLYKDKNWNTSIIHPFNAKEKNKTVESAFKIVDFLQRENYTKKETLITIGGGITQDVSAFARAVYKRGIDWAFVPTTLLAMSDSCIGSKSAINYKGTKNLIGLFSAPKDSIICEEFLNTLDIRDVFSGYGEILKLSIVGGVSSLNHFNNLVSKQKQNPLKNIGKLIRLSLLVKKTVIEADEFEFDIRRALNYGHTIGHAIEPLVKYKIPHGVAVSIGMIAENMLANQQGVLSKEECDLLNNSIIKFIDSESLGLLNRIPIDLIIENMKKDKKAQSNKIFIAVPFKIGHFDMLQIDIDSNFSKKLKNILDKISTKNLK